MIEKNKIKQKKLSTTELKKLRSLHDRACEHCDGCSPSRCSFTEGYRRGVKESSTLKGGFPIRHIVWRDSNIFLEQMETGDWENTNVETIETVGFLVGEHKDSIVLAGDYIGKSGENIRRIIVIPRESIVSNLTK